MQCVETLRLSIFDPPNLVVHGSIADLHDPTFRSAKVQATEMRLTQVRTPSTEFKALSKRERRIEA